MVETDSLIGIGQTPGKRLKSEDWVLIAAGMLLLVAAGLKLVSVISGERSVGFVYTTESLAEFALAFWLILGFKHRRSWMVSLAAFATFAGISLFKALVGRKSCGCFGPVQVNPWYTFALDTIVVISLLLWPQRQAEENTSIVRFGITGILLAAMMGLGGWASVYERPAWLHADGHLSGGMGVVRMDPVQWTNHRLPLLKYMKHSVEYAHGKWLLVLYHHDCQVCQAAIRQVQRQNQRVKGYMHIVLMEVPPKGKLPASISTSGMSIARAHFGRSWSIPMFPLYLDLNNGIVTRVRAYEPGHWSGY